MPHAVDADAVLSWWDNGAVVAEFTDDETIAAIAKALKAKAEDVRAVLVANGRVGE